MPQLGVSGGYPEPGGVPKPIQCQEKSDRRLPAPIRRGDLLAAPPGDLGVVDRMGAARKIASQVVGHGEIEVERMDTQT